MRGDKTLAYTVLKFLCTVPYNNFRTRIYKDIFQSLTVLIDRRILNLIKFREFKKVILKGNEPLRVREVRSRYQMSKKGVPDIQNAGIRVGRIAKFHSLAPSTVSTIIQRSKLKSITTITQKRGRKLKLSVIPTRLFHSYVINN